MKTIVIAFIFLVSGLVVFSQKQAQKNVSFTSINSVGALSGSQKDALIIQSINGISYKNWSTGIGVGIDAYSERSIPLFLDIRRSFGKRDNKTFVYADGGINFGWLNFIQRENRNFPEYDQPSWYYDAGVGWDILLGKKTAFVISAGYSLKQLTGHRINYGPGGPGRLNEYQEEFENTYRRISIKLGVRL